MKREITYVRIDGTPLTIEYDSEDPCRLCGLPVVSASMGGTAICPWCDLGHCRFDKTHRVDMEGFDPVTGKARLPRVHYEQNHADRISAPASRAPGGAPG